jgi:hypothetical protein
MRLYMATFGRDDSRFSAEALMEIPRLADGGAREFAMKRLYRRRAYCAAGVPFRSA